jgi:hypothetical protein
MEKISSILDYSFPTLDPAVFNKDLTLYEYQRDFVLRILSKMYSTYNLKSPEKWVDDVVILGSLSTSKWLTTSDMDVHVRVNVDEFRKINMPEASIEEAYAHLDTTRKEFDRAKILCPMTQHPIEVYFESLDTNPSNIELVGVYSLKQDVWLKEPVIFPADLDYEESKRNVVEQAEALAEELDSSLGKIKRDIQRIGELENVIKAWDTAKQKLFYSKIEQKLNDIEEEIKNDLKIKQDLVDARHENQDATSDTEIKFKWLQRFGFFGILSNLKELLESTGGQVTTEELPLIEKIISEGSVKQASNLSYAYWVDPAGKIYTVRPNEYSKDLFTHSDWVVANQDLLKEQYGLTLDLNCFKIIKEMYAAGWARIGDSGQSDMGYGITVGSLSNIPEGVDIALAQFYKGEELIVDGDSERESVFIDDPFPNLQQAVNKALSQKRMGSIKEAFLKQAFDKQDICVDLDKTIAQDAEYPAIGDPVKGSKEALEKLQDFGYNVIIYTCRAATEEGVDLVRDYLDKHDIPYDSIFEGEKPFAKFYIDDHAIQFKGNWDNVLKQVEKTEKKASLHISSAARFWVDPSGKVYPVTDNHEDWLFENKDLLQKQYGYVEDTAGQSWWDIKTINLLRQLLQDGWLRVGDLFDVSGEGANYGKHFIGQGIELADINRVPDSLFNFTSNFGKDKYFLIEDMRRRYAEVSVEELMADGQEAINRALQRKNMVHASLDLITIDPKTFKRTEPYALFIGTSNYGKAGKFDMFNVYGQHPMITEHNQLPTVGLDTLVKENIPIIGKEPRAGDKQPAQDISSLFKQASLSQKYWVDPSGKEIALGKYGHLDWIYLNMLGSPKDMSQGEIEFATTEKSSEMLLNGWTRVTTETDFASGFDFALEVANLKQLPSYLDNFIVNHYTNGGIELNDLDGNYIQVQDPFPSIQKAVNKAFRQPVTAKAISKKEIIAQTKKVKQGDYGCLMALVPHDLAQEIVAWGVRNISDDALFMGEDRPLGRELESHITIKYGLVTDDAKTVRRLFNDEKPYHVKLGKVKHFQPPELPFDVVTVEIISNDLEKANKKVEEHLECAEGLPSDEYHPHITIAYVKRDMGKDFIGSEDFQDRDVILDTVIFSPRKGNRTYFSISKDKESQFILEKINKLAEFLPSLFQAPDNRWQFEHGGDDKEIALDPDPVSDETTWYAPCTEGKPRTKEVWRQFISIFQNPISKKDDMKIQSDNKELEEAEKDALGEDQTLLEYSKGFYDPKKHDFPHNTTWDPIYQDGEPYKPGMPVTYSPESNPDNFDQNSPGGYPRRFCGKPKGEWTSNDGDITNNLMQMFKNKESAINNITRDITADLTERGYWIDPSGKFYTVRESGTDQAQTHEDWIRANLKNLQDLYPNLPKDAYHIYDFLLNNGWVRIGDSFGQEWAVESNTPLNLPSSVIDWMNTNVSGSILVGEHGKSANDKYIKITLPVDDLRETINNEFKRQRLAPVAKQSITATFNAGGWISPNGQYIETNDHFGYVATHLADFGLSQLEEIQTKFELDSAVVRSMQHIFDQGWIRVRDWDGTLMVQGNTFQNIKEHAEEFIYNNLADVKRIRIETNDEQAYVCTTEDFKIDGWEAFLKQPVMAKQASIEEIDGLTVFVNPTEQELMGFSRNLKGGRMFRGLLDSHTGDMYVWDAYEAIHTWVIQKLGLDVRYSDDSPFCLYFNPSPLSISEMLERQQEVKQGKIPRSSSLKQAGDQSASVPDYLMNEWKTDQINDDMDEEPYVNHDQRDYPYGMHDSPENTDSGIGWAKDNQPYVVRLDILENPAYRLDPFGIGSYNAIWYESLPAGDGIEQTNPD